MAVVLASASPRRQELLRFAVSEYICDPADVDEVIPEGISAFEAPEYLAGLKARAASEKHPDDTVIGCDTVVICDDVILGKPADENAAREYLKMLSGKTHSVVTGVCVISGGRTECFSEETKVTFYPLDDDEINDYIETGDPMDKAGAYGIQTEGCMLVKSVEGDFFSVVGLPVARLGRLLREMGVTTSGNKDKIRADRFTIHAGELKQVDPSTIRNLFL